MKILSKKNIKILNVILFCLYFIISVGMIRGYYNDKARRVRKTLDYSDEKISESLNYVESRLSELQGLGQALAKEISEKKPDNEELEKMLRSTAEKNDHLNGIGLAFRPFKSGNGKKLYAPYYRKNGFGRYEMSYVEDRYDYTDGRYDWYELPLKRGAAVWMEPYYGEASDTYILEYVIPVSINEKSDAVLSVNYSLSNIRDYMALSEMDSSGYSVIITSTGRFVYHPDEELVLGGKNVFDIARDADNDVLKAASENAIKGRRGRYDYSSVVSGLNGWLLYRPLSISGWAVLSVVDRHDAQLGMDDLKKHGMRVSLVLIIMFCLFCIIFVKRYYMRTILCTFALIVGIGTIWYLVINSDEKKGEIISSEISLNKFKKKYDSEFLKKHLPPPVYIPTGLFIQSIEYKGSNNVEITGYIWQKYSKEQNIEKGLIFPEAVNIVMKKMYNEVYEDYEVVGWYFEVTVREIFDYSKYPLDRDNLWLRIWHKNFYKNIILVPDLESYQLNNPKALSGIESDIVLQGKRMVASFFSYKSNSYKTDFGIKGYMGEMVFPELYYNMMMSRKFLDAFISHLIPLIVVVSLLYFILLMNIMEKAHALNVLAACSGLFFVAIFDHIGLRHSLCASGIIYLEYFYFITYFALLAVSVNSYLYAFHENISIVSFSENIYPRVYFWPLITGILYIVTFIVYY